MQDYRKLKVWEAAHALVLAIYRVTTDFPREEQFGLASQMRRSAASIPTNIVEGCGRSTQADFLRFLYISMGSAKELEYQLLLSSDLGLLTIPVHQQLREETDRVTRMLSALISTVKRVSPGERTTTNDERRTTNDERRTTNDERQTTNDERPTP